MVTFEKIKNNGDIRTYIKKADEALSAIGYTEHSFAHVTKVAEDAGYIMSALGANAHTVELCKIAGFMHDIGNLVNRVDHSQSGAVMAFQILTALGMDAPDVSEIVRAIGNHDEGTGTPVSDIAAALILADKCDVRRSRVRSGNIDTNDIHDRVNFSVSESNLTVDRAKSEITLKLEIDDTISPVMDYFEIFTTRMKLCKSAAKTLGLSFRLIINKQTII
jgi:metal-dependent HD superfamily phosphatase/phosphodiesterase